MNAGFVRVEPLADSEHYGIPNEPSERAGPEDQPGNVELVEELQDASVHEGLI